MTRLIDADALLIEMDNEPSTSFTSYISLVKNAPTVQREGWVLVPNKMTDEMENCWDGYYDGSYTAEECYNKMLNVIRTQNLTHKVQHEGWVSVDELQKLYDDMFRHKDIAISANSLFKLINHE